MRKIPVEVLTDLVQALPLGDVCVRLNRYAQTYTPEKWEHEIELIEFEVGRLLWQITPIDKTSGAIRRDLALKLLYTELPSLGERMPEVVTGFYTELVIQNNQRMTAIRQQLFGDSS